jgi:hypothetical protein
VCGGLLARNRLTAFILNPKQRSPDMRKQYRRNLRLIQNSNTDAHAEKPLILQLLVNEVSLIKLFILDSGLIILLLLGLAALIKEVRRPEVILDTIEVPEDIAKQGYAGNIVAEQFADVALNIELETQELSAQNSWHKYAVNMPEVETNAHIPDISVPGHHSQFDPSHDLFGKNWAYTPTICRARLSTKKMA